MKLIVTMTRTVDHYFEIDDPLSPLDAAQKALQQFNHDHPDNPDNVTECFIVVQDEDDAYLNCFSLDQLAGAKLLPSQEEGEREWQNRQSSNSPSPATVSPPPRSDTVSK